MNTYPRHYCGIFAVKDMPDAARYVGSGLYALQHRGQESAGIISTDGDGFFEHKDMGLVPQIFTDPILRYLKGNSAVGHNRYATTGGSEIKNAQPLSVDSKRGLVALAHNGNLTNTQFLRKELENKGLAFQTTTDSEIMLLLLAQSDGPIEEAVLDMMDKVEGAYSIIIMTPDTLIAARDPHGFRPLAIGTLDGNPVISSETCAFDVIRARFEREVSPGEVVVFKGNGVRTLMARKRDASASGAITQEHFCAFEKIYFARPDSIMGGKSVYSTRFAMGEQLAKEHPIDADIVVPIPDGGVYAAMGFAKARGIDFVQAFVRNHYVGRSFINPTQSSRDVTVNFKLNLIPELVKGKRVVVVDDSIVRGTTSQARVRKLKEAGASEVHMLVSCPPHRHPCHYGIDFPDSAKLIAVNHSIEEIKVKLGLDSLGYLSEEGLMQTLGGNGHCVACFNGKYPVVPA